MTDPGDRIDRLVDGEPLVDTVLLDRLREANMPLRGEIRERALDRMRARAKQRRTIPGVSERLANQIVSPYISEIGNEVENALSERLQDRFENTLENGRNRFDR